MPDYAPNATGRYKAYYRSAGFNHSMTVRFQRGTSGSSMITNGAAILTSLIDAVGSLMPTDFAWLDAAVAAQDSDVFSGGVTLPDLPVETGVSVALYTPIMRGTATTLKGKGGPSKVSLALFGMFWDPSDVVGPAANGRVESSESSRIAAAVAVLNTGLTLYSVANEAATWYPFATIKPNDHYVGLARRLFP